MKRILAILCIGFFCLMIIDAYFEKTATALADGVIRLHVLANSNTKEDQELKLKVRNRVINELEPLFDEDTDILAAREVVVKNIHKIKNAAADEIIKNGFCYSVDVCLEKSDFPTKEYGEFVLPAGTYEALKIKIGKAVGENWWCVLFPPLCFVDESCVTFTGSSAGKLVSGIGLENADFIKKDKSPKVKLKFKSYEIWQSGKQRIAYLFGFK